MRVFVILGLFASCVSSYPSQDVYRRSSSQCAGTISSISQSMGLDFGYAEHLLCISDIEFNDLLTLMANLDIAATQSEKDSLTNNDLKINMELVTCAIDVMKDRISEIAARRSSSGRPSWCCDTMVPDPTRSQCDAALPNENSVSSSVAYLFKDLSDLTNQYPNLNRLTVVHLTVLGYRMREISTVLPREFGATKVQIACIANGIASYLQMHGPDKRTLQEVAGSESESSSECSSIIQRAITATGFDFTDMSDMTCLPTDRLIRLTNRLTIVEQTPDNTLPVVPEEFQEDLGWFMIKIHCVFDLIGPTVRAELNRRRQEMDYLISSDCPAPRQVATRDQCESVTASIAEVDVFGHTGFGAMIASRLVPQGRMALSLLNVIMQKSRTPDFTLPESAPVSVVEFDCITQRIRDELEGMLAEESDGSRKRSEEAKGFMKPVRKVL